MGNPYRQRQSGKFIWAIIIFGIILFMFQTLIVKDSQGNSKKDVIQYLYYGFKLGCRKNTL